MKLIIEIEVKSRISAFQIVNHLQNLSRKGFTLLTAKLGDLPVEDFKKKPARMFLKPMIDVEAGLIARQLNAIRKFNSMSLSDLRAFGEKKGIKNINSYKIKQKLIDDIIKLTFKTINNVD